MCASAISGEVADIGDVLVREIDVASEQGRGRAIQCNAAGSVACAEEKNARIGTAGRCRSVDIAVGVHADIYTIGDVERDAGCGDVRIGSKAEAAPRDDVNAGLQCLGASEVQPVGVNARLQYCAVGVHPCR